MRNVEPLRRAAADRDGYPEVCGEWLDGTARRTRKSVGCRLAAISPRPSRSGGGGGARCEWRGLPNLPPRLFSIAQRVSVQCVSDHSLSRSGTWVRPQRDRCSPHTGLAVAALRTRDGLATAAAALLMNSRLVLVSSELFTNQPRADLRVGCGCLVLLCARTRAPPPRPARMGARAAAVGPRPPHPGLRASLSRLII